MYSTQTDNRTMYIDDAREFPQHATTTRVATYDALRVVVARNIADNAHGAFVEDCSQHTELTDADAQEMCDALHAYTVNIAESIEHMPAFNVASRMWNHANTDFSVRDALNHVRDSVEYAMQEIDAIIAIAQRNGIMEYSERDERGG